MDKVKAEEPNQFNSTTELYDLGQRWKLSPQGHTWSSPEAVHDWIEAWIVGVDGERERLVSPTSYDVPQPLIARTMALIASERVLRGGEIGDAVETLLRDPALQSWPQLSKWSARNAIWRCIAHGMRESPGFHPNDLMPNDNRGVGIRMPDGVNMPMIRSLLKMARFALLGGPPSPVPEVAEIKQLKRDQSYVITVDVGTLHPSDVVEYMDQLHAVLSADRKPEDSVIYLIPFRPNAPPTIQQIELKGLLEERRRIIDEIRCANGGVAQTIPWLRGLLDEMDYKAAVGVLGKPEMNPERLKALPPQR